MLSECALLARRLSSLRAHPVKNYLIMLLFDFLQRQLAAHRYRDPVHHLELRRLNYLLLCLDQVDRVYFTLNVKF